MTYPEKNINELFKNRHSKLRQLCEQAEKIHRLNTIIENHLDAKLRAHCKVSRFEQGTLVIDVDNSHWVHHIRYRVPELISEMRRHIPGLSSIQCRVCIHSAS